MKKIKKYHFLIVGSGFFGAVFAYLASRDGKSCLVLEKRPHIGGNCATEKKFGIQMHLYGPHIFHTSDREVWDFIRQFAEFNNFIYSPLAHSGGKLYNLPFNMNTFYQLWGTKTPGEAKKIIEEQTVPWKDLNPKNLEEQALKLAGKDLYEKLIQGYSEKQWGRCASEIPASVIRRIPFRFRYDNNYFSDPYQGIPIGGYSQIFKKMLRNIDVRVNTDFLKDRTYWENQAEQVLFTGKLDEYFEYRRGELDYRSLRFEEKYFPDTDNYQGVAVVNYPDREIPYTRVIEHKHFEFGTSQQGSVVSVEYPEKWTPGKPAFYPVGTEKNLRLAERYKQDANDKKILFGGRLGEYQYYNMDQTIRHAMNLYQTIKRRTP